MDPTTPVNIAKGAVATCEFVLNTVVAVSATLATGSFTALLALARGSSHPTPLALSAGTNGGIAGAIFFGTREVIVTPLLQATLRNGNPSQGTSSSAGPSSQPTWTQLRTYHLLDSATSGALTGAIINKWRNGRVLAGARTAGLICTFIQLGFNELGVMRIKYVSRELQKARSSPEPVPQPAPSDAEKYSWFDRALSLIGFRKMSDEEYLKTLKKQRDEALQRIADLERGRSEQTELQDPDRSHPTSGTA
ncbi:hypothetical protein BD413DRAFT_600231 [Trametes elegans]|nr:hypothetical protein BD413DRAFT_600231 [Trametes elegans]